MDDLEYIKLIGDRDFHKEISKRLRQIRLELRKKDPKYTQQFLIKTLSVDKSGFIRLEQFNSESFSLSRNIFIKLLIYYNSLGYNIEWILKPNNETINKFRVDFQI